MGSHTCYFKAVQGTHVVTTSPLNFTVVAPTAGHDLTLHTLELSTNNARPDSSVDILAQINNAGDYAESNITAQVHVTGPGGYSWPQSVSIGSLAAGGIWGKSKLTTWVIPPGAANGEYLVQVTVSSPAGDENWNDNTRTQVLYVSDGEQLVHMTYQYRFYQANWNANPGITGWSGGAYGPVTTSYGGKTYTVYMYASGPNPPPTQYRMYIRDQNNSEYVTFYGDWFDISESMYADDNKIVFSVYLMASANPPYAWLRLGHPVTSGATMTPALQQVAWGSSATYVAHIPCSYCSYSAKIFEGSGGDDPPKVFFNKQRSWGISRSGQDFTITASPYALGLKTFAFATEKADLTTDNFFVYGKIEGYDIIDNPPTVAIESPVAGQTLVGSQNVVVTALDDRGVNRVEFFVDGSLRNTDTAAPYLYAWDTAASADGSHTVSVTAYDSAGQSASRSVGVVVDNNPPAISAVSHSPSQPRDTDEVAVQATITDVGIAVASLAYSVDGGTTWTLLPLVNSAGTTWQATIPTHDAGQVAYKLSATDGMGRTSTTGQYSYQVRDASPPVLFGWALTPADVTEDTVGPVRVTVSAADAGGSGLAGQTPQIDYHFASTSYDGYEQTFGDKGDER